MAEPIVHDLDVLRPAPEYVVLAGRRFDMSRIPSGVALEIVADWEKFSADARAMATGTVSANMESMTQALGIVTRLVRQPFSLSNIKGWWHTRRVSKRWLIRHTDIRQLRRFIELCIDLLFKSLNSGVEEEESHGPPP